MRTKIIATLGPSSEDPAIIEQLIRAGVVIFRYNFSHATYPEYEKYYHLIHQLGKKVGREVAVLQDLQGPRIRIGDLKGGSRELKTGTTVTFSNIQTDTHIPITDPRLIAELRVGDPILIDSGLVVLEVVDVKNDQLSAKIIRGGTIRTHKGINVPRTPLSIHALSPKDKDDVIFALGVGVEYIALSFVQDRSDIEELRALIHGHNVQLVPKIERAQAVKNIDEITQVSDLIMIARGDLGVELPPEEIPIVQRELIRTVHRHHKPVVVATQLLSSMIENPQPTRAEMSDIVTAVEEGAEFLMVSDETAIGKHPVEVIEYLVRGIDVVEREKNRPLSRPKSKRQLGKR